MEFEPMTTAIFFCVMQDVQSERGTTDTHSLQRCTC